MIVNTFVVLLLSYISILTIFIVNLRISQRYNIPYLFYLTVIISLISVVYIPSILAPQSTDNFRIRLFIGTLNIQFTLKFLELVFYFPWEYVREMPWKFTFIYLNSFPQMPESKEKFLSVMNPIIHRQNIQTILRGICQLIIIQMLLYFISSEWLSAPSSSLPPVIRYLRYALFSVLLYLAIDAMTGVGFGTYGFLFNIQMKPIFPAFPFASTSLRQFWSRRWNRLIQTSLHLLSFVIIPNLLAICISLNNTAKSFLAFTISGFIHEYVLWFATGIWSGRYMIFFWIHFLLILFEIQMKFPINPSTFHRKVLGWLWTTGITWITTPLFFDPIIESTNVSNVK